MNYPKRLIEVDLPIARISAHARREKSIRHGHISTLHIWWARRPLAACRAVICAALWPDPVDELCPPAFRQAAAAAIVAFAQRVFPPRLNEEEKQLKETASKESLARWEAISKVAVERMQAENDGGTNESGTNGEERMENEGGRMKNSNDDVRSSCSLSPSILRAALLDFIADFANWDNSTVPAYLETARALTQAAHEALGGAPGTRPLVVDPFAGGGSIPLEALRVGADAFASDLNPVAVLLNKVVLEYIPKYGQRLADEVRKWGAWIKEQAEKELAEFYPKDPDGATPIAYLWARTITCEGPGCGAEVPLIRSLWLAKKANRGVALRLVPNPVEKRVDFDIMVKTRAGWVLQAENRFSPSQDLSGEASASVSGSSDRASGASARASGQFAGTNGPSAGAGRASAVLLAGGPPEPAKDPLGLAGSSANASESFASASEVSAAASRPIPDKEMRFDGTVKRGSATCPCCGYTTPVLSVRAQFRARSGGTWDARMFCVVTGNDSSSGRFYRHPNPADELATARASQKFAEMSTTTIDNLCPFPDELIADTEPRRVSVPVRNDSLDAPL